MTCESYVPCLLYAFKMWTDSFKKNLINDQLRIDKYSKERERRVRVWPRSRLTFAPSPLLEKVREERVGRRCDLTGGSLVRKRAENGCGPIREPSRKQVGFRQRRSLLNLRKGSAE